METPSFSYKLESRPGQLLIDHLTNTSNACLKSIQTTAFTFGPETEPDVIGDVAGLIGFTHDLGKATMFFQDYIKENDEQKKRSMKNDEKTHHGFLSSLFTYRIVRDYINGKNLMAHPLYGFLPIISWLIVKKHHGNPINLKDEIFSINPINNPEKPVVIKNQLHAIDAGEFNRILAICPNCDISLARFSEEIETVITKSICREENKKRRKALKENIDIYFLFQFLYSSLLSADKCDAAGLEMPEEKISLPADLVDNYIGKKFEVKQTDNLINPIRDEIYKTVSVSAGLIDINDKILSINVPTGTGKTLTGLSFALKLRKRLSNEADFIPKIIYCLPFLSVIEQNFNVFEDVFQVACNRKPHSREMLKHHHLAEMTYQANPNDEEFPSDISRLLIEGWESEIVVTTFMQLFHTLISSRNRMIRKFNAMSNAIIILDEIQTFPCKYWHLIRNVFMRFGKIFNTRFILMTATQPLIFKQDEIKELVPTKNKNHYLSQLDRISFINRSDEEMDLCRFTQILKDDMEKYPEDDFLIVLNTINTSIDVYNELKKYIKVKKDKSVNLFYLSTNIIPRHRLERIEGKNGIKHTKKRKIIVSTQLVEAGVDIDVDRVYRDFAPLDSINQVAGRCNRNFSENRKKGIVTLFCLKNRQPYYRYIYNNKDQSIFYTQDILEGKKSLTEENFLKLGDEYFKKMAEDIYDVSTDLIDHLCKLNFEEINKFKLIEAEYPTGDIFIEIDDTASEIWQKYLSLRDETDSIKRKDMLSQIKGELYSHIISVPIKHLPHQDDNQSTIIFINKNQLYTTYDMDTGFIRKDPVQCVF